MTANKPRVRLVTFVDPSVAERVTERARRADRTVAAELRQALRAWLATEDEHDPALD